MKTSTNMMDQVEEYLAFRRNLGYALESDGKELILFARYADTIGHHGPLTKTLAIHFLFVSLQQVDLYLVRWAMGKFKGLRGHKRRASEWLNSIRIREPRLFAHWQAGMSRWG